jgi:phosphatidylinositol kinase/protein kinase (PI-3  family)
MVLGYGANDGPMKDSTLPCFAASGDQTAAQLRERFQQALTHSLVVEHVDKLIDTSLGSTWTRLYDSVSLMLSADRLIWI